MTAKAHNSKPSTSRLERAMLDGSLLASPGLEAPHGLPVAIHDADPSARARAFVAWTRTELAAVEAAKQLVRPEAPAAWMDPLDLLDAIRDLEGPAAEELKARLMGPGTYQALATRAVREPVEMSRVDDLVIRFGAHRRGAVTFRRGHPVHPDFQRLRWEVHYHAPSGSGAGPREQGGRRVAIFSAQNAALRFAELLEEAIERVDEEESAA